MKRKSVLVTILMVLAFSLSTYAAYWESPVKQVGSISPKLSSQFGRLLFRFDLPQQLDRVVIDYAELVFTATPDTGSGYICLMGAYPVTRGWTSDNISWSETWTNTGGDYADSIYSTCVIRTSTDRPTRMDITDIVQMWANGDLANYGLILMPLEDSGRFLKLHSTPGMPEGAQAKVRVYFTPEGKD